MIQETAFIKDLAELVGYTDRRIRDINKNLDDDRKLLVKHKEGQYDVKIFINRWTDYIRCQALEGITDLDAVKAEHELVKKEKTEIEVRRMRGELIEVQAVKALWGEIINTVMQNMIHLPSKIAPMVIGKTNQNEIANIIDVEISNVLDIIADTPVPDDSEGEE